MRIANIALSVLSWNMNPEEYLWIPLTCLHYLILFQAKSAKSSEFSLKICECSSAMVCMASSYKIWIYRSRCRWKSTVVLPAAEICCMSSTPTHRTTWKNPPTDNIQYHTSHTDLFSQYWNIPIQRHVMSRVMKFGCPALGSCAGIQKVLSSPSMAFSGPKGLPGLSGVSTPGGVGVSK